MVFSGKELFSIWIVTLTTSVFLYGQYEPIKLSNPDFEGTPAVSSLPPGWLDCGFPEETPPDTHPGFEAGFFNVKQQAQSGRTFIGLVTRDNDTWEATATRLEKSLDPGTCYSFNLYLSRSTDYLSQKKDGNTAFFTTPAVFRIWGGSSVCDRRELLGSTSVITHTRWVRYQFTFEPKSKVNYLILEAFYQTPVLFPYNGNILVDNASIIRPIPCTPVLLEDEEEEVVAEKPAPPTAATPPKLKPAEPKLQPKKEEVKLAGVSRNQLKAGQVIGVDKLFFQTDSYSITKTSYATLDELFNFLDSYKEVSIEIGGHTNSNCDHPYCDELSEKRSKAVVDYLVDRGIGAQRLKYKGYGKRKPVASNNTLDGRRRNQRVEIRVLEVD